MMQASGPGIRIAVAILSLVGIGVLLRVLSDILLPFVAGMGIAYLFNPLADRLVRLRLSRGLASFAILTAFFIVAIAIVVILFPLLQAQIIELIVKIPTFAAKLRAWAEPLIRGWLAQLPAGTMEQVQSAAGDHAGDVLGWVKGALAGLWRGGMALLNLLSLLVVTPIVAFYFLRDWPLILDRLGSLIPIDWKPVVHQLVHEIDSLIAAFVRGQAVVCLLLGAMYATGLVILNLEFGLLIGLGSGLLSFIPYVGMGLGLVVAVMIAFVQYPTWAPILMVLGVFTVGQIIESFVLTPKLIGERVGLHPLWIIFALFAGAALFGFTGMLLAVPAAASIGVLIRFTAAQYRTSAFYLGPSGRRGTDD